jgi:hypothetical protein
MAFTRQQLWNGYLYGYHKLDVKCCAKRNIGCESFEPKDTYTINLI